MVHLKYENFHNLAPVVTSQGSQGGQKYQMLLTFEENGLGS